MILNLRRSAGRGVRIAALSAAVIAVGAPAGSAWACACCVDPGERHNLRVPIKDFTADTLSKLQFADRANLYMTAAGWEDEVIRGLNNPAKSEVYRVNVSVQNNVWEFSFKDDAGNSGALRFVMPKTVRQFAADQRPQGSQSGNYVSTALYKEWTLTNTVSQSGMFDKPVAGANVVKLILHGRGNSCTDASQFTNWTLEVYDAPPADGRANPMYRFFGKMK